MKKVFVFDKIVSSIDNIDESTIIRETGIDAEKVKESAMKEIKSKKNKKKMSIKKIFSIVAIAAAIAATATVTAQAATGGYNSIFCELFAGEPANGVFPGEDISVKSDLLDIEFVGITGDETEMYSIYNITRKDGENFVDTADDYCFLGTNADMEVSESVYKKLKIFLDGGRGWGSGVGYELIDEKTIRATAVFADSAGCIKGERLTVTDTETTIYHIDEVLYKDTSDDFIGCYDFMEKNKNMIEEKTKAFGDGQIITPMIRDGHAELTVVTMKTIPFKYELGVKLSYKTIEKIFSSAKGRNFKTFNTDWTIEEIKAGAFGMTIDVSTEQNNIYQDFDLNDKENWSDEKLHDYMNVSTDIELLITCKDGKTVHSEGYRQRSNYDEEGSGKLEWKCTYYKDKNSKEPITVDPNNIVSIKLNGTELIG